MILCINKRNYLTEPKDEICKLPTTSQSNFQCKAYFKMWTYSVEDEVCKEVVYGGCGGTANLFTTEDECKQKCILN